MFGEKPGATGITTTDDMLAKGGPRAGRIALAETTGIDAAKILEWVNHADLMRLRGVGSE